MQLLCLKLYRLRLFIQVNVLLNTSESPPMTKNGVDFLLTKGLMLIKSHFLLSSKANECAKSQ